VRRWCRGRRSSTTSRWWVERGTGTGPGPNRPDPTGTGADGRPAGCRPGDGRALREGGSRSLGGITGERGWGSDREFSRATSLRGAVSQKGSLPLLWLRSRRWTDAVSGARSVGIDTERRSSRPEGPAGPLKPPAAGAREEVEGERRWDSVRLRRRSVRGEAWYPAGRIPWESARSPSARSGGQEKTTRGARLQAAHRRLESLTYVNFFLDPRSMDVFLLYPSLEM
jgi:hypothetical protein